MNGSPNGRHAVLIVAANEANVAVLRRQLERDLPHQPLVCAVSVTQGLALAPIAKAAVVEPAPHEATPLRQLAAQLPPRSLVVLHGNRTPEDVRAAAVEAHARLVDLDAFAPRELRLAILEAMGDGR